MWAKLWIIFFALAQITVHSMTTFFSHLDSHHQNSSLLQVYLHTYITFFNTVKLLSSKPNTKLKIKEKKLNKTDICYISTVQFFFSIA